MRCMLWTLRNVTRGESPNRLKDITMSINAGVTAIVGPSGAGKSTLLELLVGYQAPDRGEIEFHGETGEALPIFWVPQGDGLWDRWTVREHVARVAGEGDAERIDEILADFDLSEKAGAFPASLSQGERSRLAVARGVATGATVLVMDEPFSTVDSARARDYWRALRRWRPPTGSLVFATHAHEAVLREADRTVCLLEGRLLYSDDTQGLYDRPSSQELAELLGPTNWFESGESRQWLVGFEQLPEGAVSYRPEQITPMLDATSPLRIDAMTTACGLTEMSVTHLERGIQRILWHRSPHRPFSVGDRVSFRILGFLCLLLGLCGCLQREDGPRLTMHDVHHWSVPAAEGKIPAPREVQISVEGEAYVLDNAGRVLVFGPNGTLSRQWEMPEHAVGNPEGLCILADGRIAVADTHYHRMVFFTRDGNVEQIIGKLGKGPGEFVYPVAVTQDSQGIIYVAEYGGNDRIQRFSPEGNYLGEFGSFGTDPGQFQRPSGLAWRDDKVYVADAINNRIQVFSDAGDYLTEFGGVTATWSLQYPYDISNGPNGLLYVIEYGAGRLTAIDTDGQLVGRWGGTGSGLGQLATPWGLAADSGDRILIADTGNRRIVELRR
jgi:iron(III) transport system ATP-binding protein